VGNTRSFHESGIFLMIPIAFIKVANAIRLCGVTVYVMALSVIQVLYFAGSTLPPDSSERA